VERERKAKKRREQGISKRTVKDASRIVQGGGDGA
jgi:hypothetical protein